MATLKKHSVGSADRTIKKLTNKKKNNSEILDIDYTAINIENFQNVNNILNNNYNFTIPNMEHLHIFMSRYPTRRPW